MKRVPAWWLTVILGLAWVGVISWLLLTAPAPDPQPSVCPEGQALGQTVFLEHLPFHGPKFTREYRCVELSEDWTKFLDSDNSGE